MFWAKTTANGRPGISVRDHCLNVGAVTEAFLNGLPSSVRAMLPEGSAALAALHDVGKITLGFQSKCPSWVSGGDLPAVCPGELALSVSDHALVSQVFLQKWLSKPARLWAVAVGAHHGRQKGRNAKLNKPEVQAEWAEKHRERVLGELREIFGPLPECGPDVQFAHHHSDLWLLAGLMSVADWIGSNEVWFSPESGLAPDHARVQARFALAQIGWPGGALRKTDFATAFARPSAADFLPTPFQSAVSEAAVGAKILIVEGPMGCGKTEAALYAAQSLVASGQHSGMYFALPTQVTSNRIHKRVEGFLRNSLLDAAAFRLAHGNAWLEDDFDLKLQPSYPCRDAEDREDVGGNLREARSWFASAKQALLAPYGVGTIDQALQAVVAVKHFFVRRFALAGKVVILDEVHSYDIYTGTLITSLIRELVSLRCCVIVLSATLTAARRRELLEAGGIVESQQPSAYPLVTSGIPGAICQHATPEWNSERRVTLCCDVITEDTTVLELIERAEAGQHVLWIRNTVVEAQQAFLSVSGAIREGDVRIGLLHSRFPFQRRADLENDWLERLGRNRCEDGGSILIATQVVEQSVDIDLDFIVSDLAPTDMLLQRVGRLWRHERHNRKAAEPVFWVRVPESTKSESAADLKRSFGRTARVYAPYVLLRTAKVWEQKSELVLPGNIRGLLEATYAEPDVDEPEAWKEFYVELEAEKAVLAANAAAATLVLGRPMLPDAEEVLTRRKGAPTTPLLLLKSIMQNASGSVALEALDGSIAEISDNEWRKASARFVHRWTVRAPAWMVPQTVPNARWLELHAPAGCKCAIVAHDGACVFAGDPSSLRYTPQLGIFTEAPRQTRSEIKDDDEFDY